MAETKYYNVTYKFRTQTSANMRSASLIIGAADVKEAAKLANEALKSDHPWYQISSIKDTGAAQNKLW